MMTTKYCTHCQSTFEFYQNRNIVPPCPRCGAQGLDEKPFTADEFYKSMGAQFRNSDSNFQKSENS